MRVGFFGAIQKVKFPLPLAYSVVSCYNIYISKMNKVVREKLIECIIKIREVFDNNQDALTENKQGIIISVDIINSKFIRNNIKLFDDTATSSSNDTQQKSATSELGTGI